ncbi:TetR/AcrR family transcriptional regulator [Syntrophomonas palmitatica]|uniref:TetR/AcrR family transcriptional regulator n=1 Tax=Syntrophomonas palmitatica TaxID=402877 RepID=UPI0006D036FD|nr:TetR/AcrR family transcriptional regulator [Syntrophomonas palmitatica]
MNDSIRSRIINTCQELARTRGFQRLTVDDLARGAGISKRTLYRYFHSKEEVIEAALDKFMQDIQTEADIIICSNKPPRELVNHMLNFLFTRAQFITNSMSLDDLRKYYPHLWQKIDAFRLERIRSIINAINERQKTPTAIDPRILGVVVTAAIQAVLNPDFILENNLSFTDTAHQLSQLLTTAFLSPPINDPCHNNL